MFKKLITGVTTLGLSVGIFSTASAEEISQPSLAIQGNTTIETAPIITPYNLTRFWSENRTYSKSLYPNEGSFPQSIQKTYVDEKGTWVGTLRITSFTDYGSSYNVIYSGTLTLY